VRNAVASPESIASEAVMPRNAAPEDEVISSSSPAAVGSHRFTPDAAATSRTARVSVIRAP
jgi:hypothetical protein